MEQVQFRFRDKVDKSIARLQEFEPDEGYYLAFSGGKDSVVIEHLARQAGVNYDAHYNITTCDPPELVQFIKREYPAVSRDKPEKSMWQLIPEKRMPPTRLVRYCCEHLKERGGSGRRVVTGIRWAESYNRQGRKMVEQCYTDVTKLYVHPIIDWTEQDVWNYIHKNNVPYCSLYDEGFSRLGCVMCPMQSAKARERDAQRWPKYRQAYLRAFGEMLRIRDERDMETTWKTPEEVMKWWIHGKENTKTIEGQQSIFGVVAEEGG